MTIQEAPLIKRLCEIESPLNFKNWKGQDGYYVTSGRVTADDVPALIEIAQKWSDPEFKFEVEADVDSNVSSLLPVTAWRTLADMKSSAAAEPLVEMLRDLEDEFDDWVSEELPHVFGKIGEAAIDPLAGLAGDVAAPEFIRSTAARGLCCVAEYFPQTRDRVVACLTESMRLAAENDIEFNTTLLVALTDLTAVEAAEPIERAFAADRLDVGMMGDWEKVRKRLGVEGLGLEMPTKPYNSVEQLRQSLGIGIFSSEMIFGHDGIDEQAETAYYDRVWEVFSRSSEGQRVIDRFGEVTWFQSLLNFSIQNWGDTVEQMTLSSVQEYVLEYLPRKVSTDSESAGAIIFELTMFWGFLGRVYKLPEAEAIVQWLTQDGLADRLEADLSDPEKFGMAKTIFMAGKNAGYDMTTQEGMNLFMKAYNQSLSQNPPRYSVEGSPSKGERVGRNDPCPCGSGKKFKKCCRN